MNAHSTYQDKKGLTIKDLVTIGIFTALFFVFELIGSIPFAPNPALTFYQSYGIALLGGPVFLLMAAKVPKHGTIAILGIINGIIWFTMGMHWGMDIGYVVMGIIADIVAGIKGFRSIKLNIFSYALFCLGPAGVLLVYSADPGAWASTMLHNGLSQDYVDMMASSMPDHMIPIVFLGTLVIAAVSGLVGSRLLRKQFKKAGITA